MTPPVILPTNPTRTNHDPLEQHKTALFAVVPAPLNHMDSVTQALMMSLPSIVSLSEPKGLRNSPSSEKARREPTGRTDGRKKGERKGRKEERNGTWNASAV